MAREIVLVICGAFLLIVSDPKCEELKSTSQISTETQVQGFEEVLWESLDYQDGYEYKLVDASEITPEDFKQPGTVLIERVFGTVINAENGDGKVLNASDEDFDYISYEGVEGLSKGATVLTYLVFDGESNSIDDITQRQDFVLE